MAIITAALLSALRVQYRQDFQSAYDAAVQASFWKDVATEVPSTTAQNTYGWLGDFPGMREWIGDRVIKDMEEHAYSITNKSFEATVGIPRVAIEDDNLGVYRPMMSAMGESAARQPDEMIAALLNAGDATLCYDGQNFFDTDHPVNAEHDGSGADASVSNILAGGLVTDPKWFLLSTKRPLKPLIHQVRKKPEFIAKTDPRNSDDVFMKDRYVYGVDARRNVGYGFWQQAIQSQAALDQASFEAAWKMMAEFKADGGRPLGIMPDMLVVPPALRASANAVIEKMLIGGGDSNPNYKAVEVKIVPWLAA